MPYGYRRFPEPSIEIVEPVNRLWTWMVIGLVLVLGFLVLGLSGSIRQEQTPFDPVDYSVDKVIHDAQSTSRRIDEMLFYYYRAWDLWYLRNGSGTQENI